MLALAREPDLYVLISGQSMFCEYPYSVLDELTWAVIGAFGPERLMRGSNFPEGGEENYCRDLALVRDQSWGLSSGDVDQSSSIRRLPCGFRVSCARNVELYLSGRDRRVVGCRRGCNGSSEERAARAAWGSLLTVPVRGDDVGYQTRSLLPRPFLPGCPLE